MEDLEGKVAVVTGAASGIGHGMARAFAGVGMRVVVADVDEIGLAAVASELDALAVPTDVSSAAAVEDLALATVAEHGAVHVLCNNAGVFTVGYQWETSLADWEWVVGVNLMGVVHGIRSFVPRMLASGEPGHVVNTASMGGLITSALSGSYTGTKHAVVGVTKGLRAELRMAKAPIGVSVVCPGEVSTGIVDHLRERYADGSEIPPIAQVTMDRLQGRLSEMGMSIDDAGALVLDAIRGDRFWVFPNAVPHLKAYAAEVDEVLAQS